MITKDPPPLTHWIARYFLMAMGVGGEDSILIRSTRCDGRDRFRQSSPQSSPACRTNLPNQVARGSCQTALKITLSKVYSSWEEESSSADCLASLVSDRRGDLPPWSLELGSLRDPPMRDWCHQWNTLRHCRSLCRLRATRSHEIPEILRNYLF
jgi:hypothetical protein